MYIGRLFPALFWLLINMEKSPGILPTRNRQNTSENFLLSQNARKKFAMSKHPKNVASTENLEKNLLYAEKILR